MSVLLREQSKAGYRCYVRTLEASYPRLWAWGGRHSRSRRRCFPLYEVHIIASSSQGICAAFWLPRLGTAATCTAAGFALSFFIPELESPRGHDGIRVLARMLSRVFGTCWVVSGRDIRMVVGSPAKSRARDPSAAHLSTYTTFGNAFGSIYPFARRSNIFT